MVHSYQKGTRTDDCEHPTAGRLCAVTRKVDAWMMAARGGQIQITTTTPGRVVEEGEEKVIA